MYNPKSTKAEEFICHEEVLDTLAFADEKKDDIEYVKSIIEKAKSKDVELIFPVDIVCTKEISQDSEGICADIEEIPTDLAGVDIGPKTIEIFKEKLKDAKTIMWNGPMGVFEIEQFAKGTNEIAKILSELDSITIIGGGDSALAVEQGGYADKMTHISTGGGASLEYIEGKILPGIDSLNDK